MCSQEGEEGERVKHHVLELLAQALAPFTPHIAEELWSNLGNSEFVSSSPWPDIFEDLLIDDTVEIAIQINGKLRGNIEVLKSLGEKDLIMMEQLIKNLKTKGRKENASGGLAGMLGE